MAFGADVRGGIGQPPSAQSSMDASAFASARAPHRSGTDRDGPPQEGSELWTMWTHPIMRCPGRSSRALTAEGATAVDPADLRACVVAWRVPRPLPQRSTAPRRSDSETSTSSPQSSIDRMDTWTPVRASALQSSGTDRDAPPTRDPGSAQHACTQSFCVGRAFCIQRHAVPGAAEPRPLRDEFTARAADERAECPECPSSGAVASHTGCPVPQPSTSPRRIAPETTRR